MQAKKGGDLKPLGWMATGVAVFLALAFTVREAVRKPAAKPLHTPLVPREAVEVPGTAPEKPRKATAKSEAKSPPGTEAFPGAGIPGTPGAKAPGKAGAEPAAKPAHPTK